jgi:LemA protein
VLGYLPRHIGLAGTPLLRRPPLRRDGSVFRPLRKEVIMVLFWVLLAIVVAVIMWLISTYNLLISFKNQVLNGWKQIDVQLKRRHDLIPNLVDTVKGAMSYEQKTLTMVIEARNKAIAAQGIADKAAQENMLTGALRQLFALVENYPNLKANENVTRLQEELVSTENRIGFARQFYNDIATKFNTVQQSFPANMVAGTFGFRTQELFEITDVSEKEPPRVDLNIK